MNGTRVTPHDIEHLVERCGTQLSPELLKAARWVVAHPVGVGLESMRSCARSAGVTPATMTRLARQLGFDGFEALREPYRRALARRSNGRDAAGYVERALIQRTSLGSGSLLAALHEAHIVNMQVGAGLNAPQEIEAAARLMLRCRQVAFLGLRASFGIAYHLHYTFGLISGAGKLLQDWAGALPDQLDALGPEDVLVVVSQAPYTRQTVETAHTASQAGVPVVALTDSPLSPIAQGARHVLLFPTSSPSFFQSMTGAQALAEALIAAVAAQGDAALIDHLAVRQARLQACKAYWERPTRPVSPRRSLE